MAPSAQLAGNNTSDFNAAAVPGEIIVKFRNDTNRQALLQGLGLKTVKKVERINAIVVKGANTKAAIAKLNADPSVLYAEPNYIAKANGIGATAPNFGFNAMNSGDDMLAKLWGMAKIEAPAAWEDRPAARASRSPSSTPVSTGSTPTSPAASTRAATSSTTMTTRWTTRVTAATAPAPSALAWATAASSASLPKSR